jgi:hypothetical protein
MSDWFPLEPADTYPSYTLSQPRIDPAYSYDDGYGYADSKPTYRMSGVPMEVYEDEEAPDVIIIKHKAKNYTLEFPAYAIADGLLTVGDVREAAADQLDVIPSRRVKLLYKGRLLKDNDIKAKSVGLKQNSLVLCVVSEDFGSEGSTSELSEPEQAVHSQQARRPRRRNNNNAHDNGNDHRVRDPDLLAEPSVRPRRQRSPSSPREQRPRDRLPDGLSIPGARSPSRTPAPSPSRGSVPKPSPSPNLFSAPPPNLTAASTPREKIEMLEHYFLTVVKPSCADYIDGPPVDPRTRDFEHKRLSEMAMTQLILKADGIELEGDEAARMRRKALIDRVHSLLKHVDDAARH